jgi:hypothetical protein
MTSTERKQTLNRGLRAGVALAALASAAVPSAAAAQSPSRPSCHVVPVGEVHGGRIAPMSHLTRIEHGKVLALNANTGAKTTIRFTARSGRWLESKSGARYAMAGQALTRDGRRGGAYLIAAKLGAGRSVLCAGSTRVTAHAADTAGRSASPGMTLVDVSITEVLASSFNRVELLRNYSTQRVCTNTRTHPDGAAPSTTNPNPSPGISCYSGRGAWLNNPDGRERDETGTPVGPQHFVTSNNATVPAAKRPSTRPNGEAVPNSAIVWRIYSPNFHNPPGV